MLLQRLATGATGVKQARYRRGPTRAVRHSYAHAQYIHSLWHLLFTMHMNIPPRVLHFSAFFQNLRTQLECTEAMSKSLVEKLLETEAKVTLEKNHPMQVCYIVFIRRFQRPQDHLCLSSLPELKTILPLIVR